MTSAKNINISLRPMTLAEFEVWKDESQTNYAEENVVNGRWAESESLAKAEESFRNLLPNGIATEHNYLYAMIMDGVAEPVGSLWVQLLPEGTLSAFIFDIVVKSDFRGKGVARAALAALEVGMREKGARSIGLHVFAHNKAARALYESCGFQVTNLNMRKDLGP